MSDISANYIDVQKRIHNACLKSGRNAEEIKLVVVTKKQPTNKINEVLRAGAVYLGENYPEQLAAKINSIDHSYSPQWHMIGHIQSRKINIITEYFSMVHSLDNIETALKLNNACETRGIKMPVLVEVNIAGESSKNGINASLESQWGSVVEFITKISDLCQLEPVGLMAMPTYTTHGESNRGYFRRCKELLSFINQNFALKGFCELSMGTSSDFEVAIEEGATYIRVGEAIMGPRNY